MHNPNWACWCWRPCGDISQDDVSKDTLQTSQVNSITKDRDDDRKVTLERVDQTASDSSSDGENENVIRLLSWSILQLRFLSYISYYIMLLLSYISYYIMLL